jgi:hypothetical protein
MAPTMNGNQTVLLLGFLLVLLSPDTVLGTEPIYTLDFSVAQPLACEAQWDLSTHRMYKLAYTWTREHTLLDWTFNQVPPKPLLQHTGNATDPGSECIQLSYRTSIDTPSFFNKYLPSHVLALRVAKRMCASGPDMQERVRFSDVLVIGEFDMLITASIERNPNLIRLSARSELEVPWYLTPVRSTLLGHIRKSITEYTQILANELCAL